MAPVASGGGRGHFLHMFGGRAHDIGSRFGCEQENQRWLRGFWSENLEERTPYHRDGGGCRKTPGLWRKEGASGVCSEHVKCVLEGQAEALSTQLDLGAWSSGDCSVQERNSQVLSRLAPVAGGCAVAGALPSDDAGVCFPAWLLLSWMW